MMRCVAAARQRNARDALSISPFATAQAVLYSGVALAVVRAPVDTAALASAAFAAHTYATQSSVPIVFGPETAAAGSLSGGLGWLGALLASVLDAAPAALMLSSALFVLVTLALIQARARHFSNPVAAVCAACVAALCLCDAAHAGGPLVAPLFAAALFALLDRPTARHALLGTLLTVVWCNLSASGLLGAIFAVAVALGASIDCRAGRRMATARLRNAWWAAAGACGATLVTPAGAAYSVLAWRALRLDASLERIVSVAPYASAPLAYAVGFMLVLVLALALGLRSLGFTGALPAIIALLLGFANGNDVPLAGVVVVPLLAAATTAIRAQSAARLALCVALITTLVINVAPDDRAARASVDSSAAAALAPLAANVRDVHRLFCAQPAWCAYAVAAGGHVLIDDRVDRAPRAVRAAQRSIARGDVNWPELVARYQIDAMLVNSDSTLASLLRLTRRWRAYAVCRDATLFVRRKLHR